MARIFVDVEDVLLLKDDEGQYTQPNMALISALQNMVTFAIFPPTICFWSSNGRDVAYAAGLQTAPLIGINHYHVAHEKYPDAPTPEDIVIDSQPFESWATCMSARYFARNFGRNN